MITESLKDIGHRWGNSDLALSQIYMTGRICEEISKSILPTKITSENQMSDVAIITLGGYHLLGKK